MLFHIYISLKKHIGLDHSKKSDPEKEKKGEKMALNELL